MSFVTNILTPIAFGVVFTFLIGWIIFLFYWVFIRIFRNFKYFFKYKILKKPFKESDIEYLMKAYNQGFTIDYLHKFLLLKGVNINRIKELLYIYKEMRKVK